MLSKLNLLVLLAACVSFAHAGAFDVSQDVESFKNENPAGARRFLELLRPDGGRALDDFNGGACSLGSAFECLADNQVIVGCAGLSKKNEAEWCYEDPDAPYCCGDECCELTGGGIAVFVVVALVSVFLITLASCACCSCCPFHSKLCCAKRNEGGGAAEPEVTYPKSVNY